VFTGDLAAMWPPVAHPPAVSWGRPAPGELATLESLDPAMTSAEVARRQAEGQECLVAWHGSDLAYFRWQTARSPHLPYLGCTLELGAGGFAVLDVFTSPAFRGRGIASFVGTVALVDAHDRGLRRAIWLVAWWNAPAFRIAREATHRRLAGAIGYRGVGRWRRYFATGDVVLGPGRGFRIGSSRHSGAPE
jgi:GNAT superfamily N-acetyltransferase